MKVSRREFLKSATVLTIASPFISLGTCEGSEKKVVRFGLMSDSHYADRDPSSVRFFRQALDKMGEAVQVFNDENVDLVIHLGDFKDQDKRKKREDTLRYLAEIESEYAKFQGARYHCIGNHDIDSISKKEFLENIVNTGIPKDRGFYSFDNSGYHFVVLDPNFSSNGEEHNNGNFKWDDANIPEHQWEWFEKDLQATKLPTFVFSHFTLFEFVRDGKHYHISNYERAQKIMEQSGTVLAVFQGHVHEERHEEINGIHYCTLLGMVDFEGMENNSFSIVEVSDGEINIKGFKRSNDLSL